MFSNMWEGMRYSGKVEGLAFDRGRKAESVDMDTGGEMWRVLREHSSSCFEFLNGKEARSKLALEFPSPPSPRQKNGVERKLRSVV